MRAEQLKLIDLAGQHFAAESQVQIGMTFARLPVEAVRTMAGMVTETAPLRTLMMKAWPQAVDGLTQSLIRGVALGWNPRKTAREMRNGVDSGLDRMLVIARTEEIKAYRTAQYEQARSMGGMVRGMKRLAARNERTCLACLLDDGHVYPIDMMPGDHVSGRCRFVVVWMGRDEDTWTSGREWLQSQDEATQRSIMGPGRYDAWQRGEIGLDDMVRQQNDPT